MANVCSGRPAQVPAMSTPGEPTLVLTQLEAYGMCCQSEVTLVKRKLELPGVSTIRVIGDLGVNLLPDGMRSRRRRRSKIARSSKG